MSTAPIPIPSGRFTMARQGSKSGAKGRTREFSRKSPERRRPLWHDWHTGERNGSGRVPLGDGNGAHERRVRQPTKELEKVIVRKRGEAGGDLADGESSSFGEHPLDDRTDLGVEGHDRASLRSMGGAAQDDATKLTGRRIVFERGARIRKTHVALETGVARVFGLRAKSSSLERGKPWR